MRLPRSLSAVVLCATTAALAVAATPAAAHESPAGCTTSGVRFQVSGNDIGIIHRNGDVISVTPRVGNFAAGACDITDATVTLSFPKPDGTEGGDTVTLATDMDFLGGADFTTFPDVQHTVNFDDGVFRGPVTLGISGTQHFPGGDIAGFIGSLGRPLVISRPHTTVSVTPSPPSGDAPLGVTYAYSVTNDSPLNPMDIPTNMFPVEVADDRCAPVVFTGGDTNMDTVLTRGETWTYTCNATFFGGAFTNHVTVNGGSVRDGRPWPEATAQSTVTVNGPDMVLSKSHSQSFTQGDSGRTYTITARNSGNRPATGPVSVADTLPSGLTATAIAGNGWSCDLPTLTCTRSDALAAGTDYPPITLTVDVAADAPANVVNTATVTRAGQNTGNDTASDPTAIGARGGDALPGPGTPSDPGAGGAGSGPGGGGPGAGADTAAPGFLAARLTNTRFAVDRRGAPEPVVAAAAAKKGTAIVYRLSEPARVVFTVERREVGRKVGRQCQRPNRRNRRRKPCVRFVKVGAFADDGEAGANTKRWSGKLGNRALKTGKYQLSMVAIDDAGNASPIRRRMFAIVDR